MNNFVVRAYIITNIFIYIMHHVMFRKMSFYLNFIFPRDQLNVTLSISSPFPVVPYFQGLKRQSLFYFVGLCIPFCILISCSLVRISTLFLDLLVSLLFPFLLFISLPTLFSLACLVLNNIGWSIFCFS